MTDPHALFARQGLMQTFGAELTVIEPGRAEIEMATAPAFDQQHGFMHAGVVMALVDTACGFATIGTGHDVVTAELKVNLLRPAVGERLRAVGRVVRAGRTLTVCQGDVYATVDGAEKHVATVLATMARVG